MKKPGGGEEQTFVRLLKFIEGSTLMHAAPSAQLYRSVGAFAAQMDQVLFPTTFGHNTNDSHARQAWTGFSHPFVRTDYAWDIKNLMGMKPYVSSLTRAETPASQISSSNPMLLLAVPRLLLLTMCDCAQNLWKMCSINLRRRSFRSSAPSHRV